MYSHTALVTSAVVALPPRAGKLIDAGEGLDQVRQK